MRRLIFFCSALLFASTASSSAVSPARQAGDLLFVSAQLPTDPRTGLLINGNIQELTDQTIDNLVSVLRIKGYKLEHVVSTQVYLADMRDFDAMDQVYSARFNMRWPPARDVFAAATNPNNARIQISCIAKKGGGGGN